MPDVALSEILLCSLMFKPKISPQFLNIFPPTAPLALLLIEVPPPGLSGLRFVFRCPFWTCSEDRSRGGSSTRIVALRQVVVLRSLPPSMPQLSPYHVGLLLMNSLSPHTWNIPIHQKKPISRTTRFYRAFIVLLTVQEYGRFTTPRG